MAEKLDDKKLVTFKKMIMANSIQLDPAHSTQLSFDLNLLSLSLAELEARYFTTTIERNKS